VSISLSSFAHLGYNTYTDSVKLSCPELGTCCDDASSHFKVIH